MNPIEVIEQLTFQIAADPTTYIGQMNQLHNRMGVSARLAVQLSASSNAIIATHLKQTTHAVEQVTAAIEKMSAALTRNAAASSSAASSQRVLGGALLAARGVTRIGLGPSGRFGSGGMMLGSGIGSMFGGAGGPVGGMIGLGLGTAADVGLAGISAMGSVVTSVASGLGQAVMYAGRLAAELEVSRIEFQVMTKDVATGNKLLDDLRKLAIATPYTAKQLIHPARTALSFGVASGDVVNLVARLGDVAAGDPGRLERLLLAYGQARGAGRLTGNELRQFTEAGIGAEDFASTMGVSQAKFMDLKTQGLVGTDVINRTIQRLTEGDGRFAGLSDRLNKETLVGALNAFQETVNKFAGDLMGRILPKLDLSGFVNRMAGLLSSFDSTKLEAWAGRMGEGLQPVLRFVEGLAQSLIGADFAALTQFAPTWKEVGDGLVKFASDIIPTLVTGTRSLIGAMVDFAKVLLNVGDAVTKIVATIASLPGVGLAAPSKEEQERLRKEYGGPEHENFKRYLRSWKVPLNELGNEGPWVENLGPEGRKKMWDEMMGKGAIDVDAMRQGIPGKDGMLKFLDGVKRGVDNAIPDGNKLRPGLERLRNQPGGVFAPPGAGLLGGPGDQFKKPFAAEPEGISRGAQNLVKRLEEEYAGVKAGTAGESPLAKFKTTLRLLDEAFAGKGKDGPLIGPETRDFGMLQAFKELERGGGLSRPNAATPMAREGSQEAGNIIASSIAQTQTAQMNVAARLEELVKAEEEKKTRDEELLEEVKKWREAQGEDF